MDLLRQMKANRQTTRSDSTTPAVTSIHSLPKPDSNLVTKKKIIEDKPKHKVLKEYFENLIERICSENESEED